MSIRSNRDQRYKCSKRNKTNKRPKTFKSEESAKAYAEKKGIKKYSMKNLKSPESKVKKIKIVVE